MLNQTAANNYGNKIKLIQNSGIIYMINLLGNSNKCAQTRSTIFFIRNKKNNLHGATSSQLPVTIFKQLSNLLTNNKLKLNCTYTHILHQNPSNRYLHGEKGKTEFKMH